MNLIIMSIEARAVMVKARSWDGDFWTQLVTIGASNTPCDPHELVAALCDAKMASKREMRPNK